MQRNSLILHTILFSPDQNSVFRLPESCVPYLLPDLSPAGIRSILHRLEKSGSLTREHAFGSRVLVGSLQAREDVKAAFPVLNHEREQWNGSWSMLVFLKPPKGDKNFRYLRSLLIKERALDLTRGVYLYPGSFPTQVQYELRDKYKGSVHIVSVAEWLMGSERPIVVQKYSLQSLLDIYSGISEEISHLLIKKDTKKGLTKKEKKLFVSLLDRFIDALVSDIGILSYYFPGSPEARTLLKNLQLISLLLSRN